MASTMEKLRDEGTTSRQIDFFCSIVAEAMNSKKRLTHFDLRVRDQRLDRDPISSTTRHHAHTGSADDSNSASSASEIADPSLRNWPIDPSIAQRLNRESLRCF